MLQTPVCDHVPKDDRQRKTVIAQNLLRTEKITEKGADIPKLEFVSRL